MRMRRRPFLRSGTGCLRILDRRSGGGSRSHDHPGRMFVAGSPRCHFRFRLCRNGHPLSSRPPLCFPSLCCLWSRGRLAHSRHAVHLMLSNCSRRKDNAQQYYERQTDQFFEQKKVFRHHTPPYTRQACIPQEWLLAQTALSIKGNRSETD